MTQTPPLCKLTLVLGGARSGKSAYAESLLAPFEKKLYLATALPRDPEMSDRIALHQARRGEGWETTEEELELAVILRSAKADRPILIDSLTLWMSNILLSHRDPKAETKDLGAALLQAPCPVVLVSDEVGLGIVPENALARSYRDALGLMNQSLAALADRVVFVAAGLPLPLKG